MSKTISTPSTDAQALDHVMNSFWEVESFGIPTTERSLYELLRSNSEMGGMKFDCHGSLQGVNLPTIMS